MDIKLKTKITFTSVKNEKYLGINSVKTWA